VDGCRWGGVDGSVRRSHRDEYAMRKPMQIERRRMMLMQMHMRRERERESDSEPEIS
jgi:hypothetical protein